MNRRELLRNSLLTIGAATVTRPAGALVFAAGDDAWVELGRPDWKPTLFSVQQNETLTALSEAIIPTTETPGASGALVNRFLDLVLSADSAANQAEFLESLDWFDKGAMERYKVPFPRLNDAEQKNFLDLVAWPHTYPRWGRTESNAVGHLHFSRLKRWIAGAYYSSPVGLKELGWDGWAARGTYSGCEHQPGEHKVADKGDRTE